MKNGLEEHESESHDAKTTRPPFELLSQHCKYPDGPHPIGAVLSTEGAEKKLDGTITSTISRVGARRRHLCRFGNVHGTSAYPTLLHKRCQNGGNERRLMAKDTRKS